MAKRMTLSVARSLDASTASIGDLRKAYTALRDVMQKRITRLAEGTEAQQAYAQPFLPGGSKELLTLKELSQLPREGWTQDQIRREMEFRVKEMQLLESSERLSMAGWKRIEMRTLESLHKVGYTNINKKNIRQFGKFMEKMRSLFGNKFFPSDEVAERFDTAQGEDGQMDEQELLSILEDLGAVVDEVDLFAW